MAESKIIHEEPLTVAEAKELLIEMTKRKEEPDYVQKKALAHAERTAKLPADKAVQLKKELMEMGIDEEKAIEVVNIMPKTRDEVRVLFSKERRPPETEEVDKIIELVGGYSNAETSR